MPPWKSGPWRLHFDGLGSIGTIQAPWWARLSDRMTVSPEAVAMCSPVQGQLLGATLEPSAAAPTPADERLPLVEAFEGRSFKQIFDREVDGYIRRSQLTGSRDR